MASCTQRQVHTGYNDPVPSLGAGQLQRAVLAPELPMGLAESQWQLHCSYYLILPLRSPVSSTHLCPTPLPAIPIQLRGGMTLRALCNKRPPYHFYHRKFPWEPKLRPRPAQGPHPLINSSLALFSSKKLL